MADAAAPFKDQGEEVPFPPQVAVAEVDDDDIENSNIESGGSRRRSSAPAGFVPHVVANVGNTIAKGATMGGAVVGKGVVELTSNAGAVGKGVVHGGAVVGKGVVHGGAVVGQGVLKGGKVAARQAQKGVHGARKLLQGGEDYTWEELQQIEKRRRDILKRRDLSFFRILTFWDGTVLSALTRDPFLYILMTIYVAIRVAARNYIPDYVSALAKTDVAVIGGFLTFFLVFYAKAANDRFQDMYELSMGAEGRIFDCASLARSSLPRERALRLVRYMNAAHIAGYIGLSDTYTFDNFFVHSNQDKGMLLPREIERIKSINMNAGGSANRELVAWCMNEIWAAQNKGIIDNRTAQLFREQILMLRGYFGKLTAYDDQPVSFFYVHFVCLLSFLYLPLFTIQTAIGAGTGEDSYWLTDMVAGLVVFFQAVYVIGLRLMADRLSEPYGSDLEDLSVIYYINFAWTMSRRILEAEMPDDPTLEEEEGLVDRARQSIGYPWERHMMPPIDGSLDESSFKSCPGFLN